MLFVSDFLLAVFRSLLVVVVKVLYRQFPLWSVADVIADVLAWQKKKERTENMKGGNYFWSSNSRIFPQNKKKSLTVDVNRTKDKAGSEKKLFLVFPMVV
jgi:hypothetical protein